MFEQSNGMRITITKNGPYLVTGNVPLVEVEIVTDNQGVSVGWREIRRIETGAGYALCRCGRSRKKPFCDGAHIVCDFEGAETADQGTYDTLAADIPGATVILRDRKDLCSSVRHCMANGKLWHLVERCDDPELRELAIEQTKMCASGRYVLLDAETRAVLEDEREPSIALVVDPSRGVLGPIWVRGGIQIVGLDGFLYERRNRVTICRCGESRNKPFCDGSHLDGFTDGRHC